MIMRLKLSALSLSVLLFACPVAPVPDGGTGGGAGGGGGAAQVVNVTADITADTTWTRNNTYVLKQLTYVTAGTDDTYDCGTLKYVRVEFAGRPLSANNELNGITLNACGSATTIDFVQVHRGVDDGIELFGGTVNLKHLVITGSDDDGLDWD